jgi:hypothetical protein
MSNLQFILALLSPRNIGYSGYLILVTGILCMLDKRIDSMVRKYLERNSRERSGRI